MKAVNIEITSNQDEPTQARSMHAVPSLVSVASDQQVNQRGMNHVTAGLISRGGTSSAEGRDPDEQAQAGMISPGR